MRAVIYTKLRLFSVLGSVLAFALSISAQEMELVLPINNNDDIVSVQFSSDNNWAITGCEDGELRIWNVASGLMLRRFQSNAGTLTHTILSSTGAFLIGTYETGVGMWDVRSGKRRWIFHSERNLYACRAALSTDNKYVAFGDASMLVTILDAQTGTVVRSFSGHKDGIAGVGFSPDSRYVASTSRDGTLKLWSIETGELVFSNHVAGNGMREVEFSASGDKLATLSYDGSVHVWKLNGELLFRLESKWQSIVHFNQDGSCIVTAHGNNAYLWDGNNGKLLRTLVGHTYWVEDARFDVSGQRVVTAGRDSAVKVWDVKTANILFDSRKHQGIVWSVNFSSTGEYLISGSADETAVIWKLDKGVLMHELTGQCALIWNAQYAGDGITMAHEYGDGLAVWDLQKGKMSYSLEDSIQKCIDFKFTPDGKRMVTLWGRGIFKLHEIYSGSVISEIKCGAGISGFSMTSDGSLSFVSNDKGDVYIINMLDGSIQSVMYTGHTAIINIYADVQSRRLCIVVGYTMCELWNYASQKRIANLTTDSSFVDDVQFLVKEKQVVTSNGNGRLMFWDVETGKQVAFIENTGSDEIEINHAETMLAVYGLDTIHFIDIKSKTEIARIAPSPVVFLVAHGGYFSKDDRYYITELDDSSIIVWNCNLRKVETRIPLAYNSVGIVFTHDESRIASVNPNGTIDVWNTHDGALVYSLHAFKNNEYLILNADGCYKSTANVTRSLHYVTNDLRTISFAQLDVRFNRPHQVLETMNSRESELIASYRDAYNKRLHKLRIDTSALGFTSQAPLAYSKDYLKYEQVNSTLSLNLFFADSLVSLSTINIWINDCPLWGLGGVNITSKRTQKYDTTITIELSDGTNRIEISAMNVSGIESFRSPVYVNYTPEKPSAPKTYFIGIGVDHFADPKYNLTWSTKDIRDMCAAMKEKYGKNFVLVDTLFNEIVTVENVQALKAKLMKTGVNDKVIIAYSGHGLLSDNYDYYLSTYNVNFHNPEENGLAYEELENLVDGIPARQKLMLIDACHSGEVDKEEMLKLKKAESDTSLHLVTNGKGFEVDAPDSSLTKLGAQNSFELMSTLFVNVSRGTGTTVIAAASGTQFAYENGELKNGVFTYCFLETMRTEKTCTVQQMKTNVSTKVVKLTNGLQRPTSRTETSGYDWVLW